MDKGIRPYAVNKFIEMGPARVNTREGNTAFRKTLMADLMEQFDVTLASAATHYNHAFISAKTTHPALCEGLGRPEDKKGGRKAKPKAEATPAATTDVAVTGSEVAGSIVDGDKGEEQTDEAPAAEAAAVVKYSVCKVSDKSVVCSDLTLDEANALIAKAASAKKAKLELVA